MAKKKKEKELFTIAFLKSLESLFRNCDEKVAKIAVEKSMAYRKPKK